MTKRRARLPRRIALEQLETRLFMSAGDPFAVDAPAFDTAAPEASTFQRGDYSVSDKNGAATYAYPIIVPPGRGGMQPTLALSYSSQAPLRGGVAAGWSLALPSIELDTSDGTLRPARFMANFGGAAGRLVQTTDIAVRGGTTYRIEQDDAFTIFEQYKPFRPTHPSPPPTGPVVIAPSSAPVLMPTASFFAPKPDSGDTVFVDPNSAEPQPTIWLARTTDGVTHYFTAGDQFSRWFLHSQEDPNGNTIRYNWERFAPGTGAIDFTLTSIEYTSNSQARLQAHARVTLEYAPLDMIQGTRIPVGASSNYRSGTLYHEGARRLTAIVTSVRDQANAPWRVVRRVNLDYDMAALRGQTNASPMRYLTGIRTTAYSNTGAATVLPPLTFKYGSDSRPWDQTTGGRGWRGTPKGVGDDPNGILLDMNGDGIPDWVETRISSSGQGVLLWYDGGGSSNGGVMRLPIIPWRNGRAPSGKEKVTLSGQYTDLSNTAPTCPNCRKPAWPTVNKLAYKFADLDGDGDADLIAALYYDPIFYNPLLAGPNGPVPTTLTGLVAPIPPIVGGAIEPSSGTIVAGAVQQTQPTSSTGVVVAPGGTAVAGAQLAISREECTFPQGSGGDNDGDGTPDYADSDMDDDGVPNIDDQDADGNGKPDLFDEWDRQEQCSPQTPETPENPRELPVGESQRPFHNGSFVWWLYRNTGTTFARMEYHHGQYADTNGAVPTLTNFELNAQNISRSNGRIIASGSPYELADLDGDKDLDIFTWDKHRNVFPRVVDDRGANLQVRALDDINGDGLPDRLEVGQDQGKPAMLAYLNTGRGFAQPQMVIRNFNFSLPYMARPLGDPNAFLEVTELSQADLSSYGDRARANLTYRVDVDGDGLADVLDLRGPVPQVYFNIGGEFTPVPRSLETKVKQYANRLFLERLEHLGENYYSVWTQLTDFADDNGDGLLDLVDYAKGPTLSRNINGAPPRHLTEVNNGAGGTIQFHYSAVTDPQIVSRTQDDLPYVFWVVDTMTLGDAYGPDPSTKYVYADPIYGSPSGREGDPERFLGFRTVTQDLPQGGRVVRTYKYDVANDARGHLVSETTYIPGTNNSTFVPVTSKEIVWANSPVQNGRATFTHIVQEITRNYEADGTAPASNIIQHSNVYLPWRSSTDGPVIMYQLRGTVDHSGLARGDDTKNSLQSYYVWYSTDRYQIETGHVIEKQALAGSAGREFTTLRDEYYRFNGQGLLTSVETNIGNGSFAVTLHDYDPKTGNLIATTKPQQVANCTGRKTTFEYDPFRIYVVRTVNELGHQVFDTYDLGTGELVRQQGPNSKLVGGRRVWEMETWRRDGVGRVLERFISVDDATLGYRQVPVEQFSYVDKPLAGQPRKDVTSQRLDFTQNRWASTERLYDGWGRLTQENEETEYGPALTRYKYGPSGDLVHIIAPRPGGANNQDTVFYVYDRDKLGRVVRFARPDNTGVTIAYAGLMDTLTELTKDGSGGQRVTRHDPFGRVMEVQEISGANGPAVWRYQYDGLDRVTRIVDADGNVTDIAYNMAGQRSTITRGNRTWLYTYDQNGNLIAETTPVPASATPAQYTTTITYDDLDRVTRRTPASRGMSAERMRKLGIGTIVFSYDGTGGSSVNTVGRLCRVDLPFGNVTYAYNAQGLVSREQRAFNVSYLSTASATQSVEREYNPLGQETVVRHDSTTWRMGYDQRGLLKSVEWQDPSSQKWQRVALYQRARSGHIVRQGNAFGQSRGIDYDELGRVIRDQIFVGATPLAERTYTYSGSGDLLAVSGQTNGVSADARYTYDGLHRLLTAQGPNGYVGEFTYSPAGNVRSASVNWTGSTQSRDVTYRYGAVDPQAVDALFDRVTGDRYASFDYNLAGAMTRRETPDGVWTFDYDGDDMLREAIGPEGHEAYYYDHNGQRVLAINDQGVRFWFGERETHFSPSGKQQKSSFHIAGAGGTVARVTSDSQNAADIELQYSDSLQNLVLTLDRNGNTTSSFLYGAFGEVVLSVGADDHTRRFNGKEDDAATGLRYYGARYYDTLTLRWTSADPKYGFAPDLAKSDPRRSNLYVFSGNNPVRYYDPDGRDILERAGDGLLNVTSKALDSLGLGLDQSWSERALNFGLVVATFATGGATWIARGAAVASELAISAAIDSGGEIAKAAGVDGKLVDIATSGAKALRYSAKAHEAVAKDKHAKSLVYSAKGVKELTKSMKLGDGLKGGLNSLEHRKLQAIRRQLLTNADSFLRSLPELERTEQLVKPFNRAGAVYDFLQLMYVDRNFYYDDNQDRFVKVE